MREIPQRQIGRAGVLMGTYELVPMSPEIGWTFFTWLWAARAASTRATNEGASLVGEILRIGAALEASGDFGVAQCCAVDTKFVKNGAELGVHRVLAATEPYVHVVDRRERTRPGTFARFLAIDVERELVARIAHDQGDVIECE